MFTKPNPIDPFQIALIISDPFNPINIAFIKWFDFMDTGGVDSFLPTISGVLPVF
jgi:hypothetical protein